MMEPRQALNIPPYPHVFPPLEAVKAALTIIRGNSRLFLSWGLPPLATWFFGRLLMPAVVLPQDIAATEIAVLANILGIMSMWFTVPFFVRVYRYIILGKSPDNWFIVQLFEGRSWRYIGKNFIAYIQLFFLSLLCVVLPWIVTHYIMLELGYDFLSKEYQLTVFYLLIPTMYLAGFMMLSHKMVLIGPNVAVDGKASLSRLGVLSKSARSRIIKVLVTIYALPFSLSYLQFFAQYLGWVTDPDFIKALDLGLNCLIFFAYAVSAAAGALIYKRLSQAWPEPYGLRLRRVRRKTRPDAADLSAPSAGQMPQSIELGS